MSFGKRQQSKPTPVKRVARSRSGPKPPEPEQPEPPRRSPLRVAAGIVLGFALLFIGNTVYRASLRQLGHVIDQRFEVQMNEAISPTPQHNLLKTKLADGWSFGSCTMQRPPAAIDNVIHGDYAERDAMHSHMMEFAGGDLSVTLVNSANFIDCVANNEAKRLCARDVRAAFATDVARFYNEHRMLSGQIGAMQRPADKKFAEVLSTLKDALPDIENAQDSVASELASSKAQVKDALTHLAAGGYVTENDFGWFAPADIKSALNVAKPAQSPCG